MKQRLSGSRVALRMYVAIFEVGRVHTDVLSQTVPTGLPKKRKKVLTRMINSVIASGNKTHVRNKCRADTMMGCSAANAKIISSLEVAQKKSVDLKHCSNDLVDMVNKSVNKAAAQNPRDAMRRWGDIDRCLIAGIESASKCWEAQNDRTWETFAEDRKFTRKRIGDLRNIAAELGLDMRQINADSTRRGSVSLRRMPQQGLKTSLR